VGEAVGKLKVPGADLHPPLADELHQLIDLLLGPLLDVVFDRPGDLGVPAKPGIIGVAVRLPAITDDIIQVLGMLLENPGLKIGITDVRVGVVEEIDRPLAPGFEFFIQPVYAAPAVSSNDARVGAVISGTARV